MKLVLLFEYVEVKYHHQKNIKITYVHLSDFQSYIIKQESDTQIGLLMILLLFWTFANT